MDGVRGVWRSRYERSRGPVCIVLLLGTLGYPGGVRDIIGGSLVHRLACRLESRQITELSKASALLRLHELLHPRVRVIDHLPAQLRRNLVHRLSRLSGCLIDAATARRLPVELPVLSALLIALAQWMRRRKEHFALLERLRVESSSPDSSSDSESASVTSGDDLTDEDEWTDSPRA